MDEMHTWLTQPQECSCGQVLTHFDKHGIWAASEIDVALYFKGALTAHDVIWIVMDLEKGYTNQHELWGRCNGDQAGRIINDDTPLYIVEKVTP